jgi:hypothetical protein
MIRSQDSTLAHRRDDAGRADVKLVDVFGVQVVALQDLLDYRDHQL